MAQLVKNPPAMRETWVQSLGWEDQVRLGVRSGKAGAKVRKRFLRKAFIWY